MVLGDSLLVVNDDEIIEVHVRFRTSGEVMNYVQKFGSLIKIKIKNNMQIATRRAILNTMNKWKISSNTEKNELLMG